ncbi:MAG: ATP-binding protein [Leptospirales bacterium]
MIAIIAITSVHISEGGLFSWVMSAQFFVFLFPVLLLKGATRISFLFICVLADIFIISLEYQHPEYLPVKPDNFRWYLDTTIMFLSMCLLLAILVSMIVRELERTKSFFHAIFNKSSVPIFIVNSEGIVVDHNNASNELFGYSDTPGSKPGVGLNVLEAHKKHNTGLAPYLESVLSGQKDCIDLKEVPYKSFITGVTKTIDIGLVQLPLPTKSNGAVATFYDVTEKVQQRKELEKTIKTLNKTRDQLVQQEKLASLGNMTSGIAHELKNPLNFINNFSRLIYDIINSKKMELAKKSNITKAELQELRDDFDLIENNTLKIEKHGKRANAIINNMLYLSRDINDNLSNVKIETIINDSIIIALASLDSKKAKNNIKFKNNYQNEVFADVFPGNLSISLVIILSNACYAVTQSNKIKNKTYTPVIEVTLEKNKKNTLIKIKDNGDGIEKDKIRKIFDPFFTTKPSGQGIGLGLSIAHDIINKKHGGKLTVKSDPGKFTEFTINI